MNNRKPILRCEDCGTDHESNGQCRECGGYVREYMPIDSPIYQVDIPSFGPIWFSEDDYAGAFQHATGQRFEEAGDDHPEESRITTARFDGPIEIPIADI